MLATSVLVKSEEDTVVSVVALWVRLVGLLQQKKEDVLSSRCQCSSEGNDQRPMRVDAVRVLAS